MTENNNEKPQEELSPEEYYVTQKKGTEPAFSGKYDGEKTPGVYNCVVCGAPLFSSKAKYDSGSGWPSFWEPIKKENIGSEVDHSAGMTRTEVHCYNCKAHLGHVFPDGPQPTGLRYCINSVSLNLKPDDEVED